MMLRTTLLFKTLGLFVFCILFKSTSGLPANRDISATSATLEARDVGLHVRNDDEQLKRLQMKEWQTADGKQTKDRKTFYDFVEEPPNSGWTRALVDEFAKKAYYSVQDLRQQIAGKEEPVQLVSALWVPGKGIALSSIPRDVEVNNYLEGKEGNVEHEAPAWFAAVHKKRASNGALKDKYHAEDGSDVVFEKYVSTKIAPGAFYPSRGNDKPYSTVFGKKMQILEPGKAKACSSYPGPPGCKQVNDALGIDV